MPKQTKKSRRISEQQVIEYLRMRPAFLADHPELLQQQRLPDPHRDGRTASLQQRQNELLRARLEEQQRSLQELSSAALYNERLLNRWHELTLELMATGDTLSFLELLDARLRSDFDADYVVLRILDPQLAATDLVQAAMVRVAGADFRPELNQLLQYRKAFCGRLIADKREAVFGEQQPASVTLVAIGEQAILAIGSDDVNRFTPGMGGLFIELLGKTVHWQLQRHAESLRKQA